MTEITILHRAEFDDPRTTPPGMKSVLITFQMPSGLMGSTVIRKTEEHTPAEIAALRKRAAELTPKPGEKVTI